MAVFTEAVTTTFATVQCCECGAWFAVDSTFRRQRQSDHNTFYCPNGHSLHWDAESPEERLRRELNEAYRGTSAVRQELADERKQHAATKGKLTKTLNRAKAGMCPHCRRTFQNYARHMQRQHGEGS